MVKGVGRGGGGGARGSGRERDALYPTRAEGKYARDEDWICMSLARLSHFVLAGSARLRRSRHLALSVPRRVSFDQPLECLTREQSKLDRKGTGKRHIRL